MRVTTNIETGWKPRFGATVMNDSQVEFKVWGPRVKTLSVKLAGRDERTIALQRDPKGEFHGVVSNLRAGADYSLILDGDRERPDPVSRCQPYGVHGPSRVVDPSSFNWTDTSWKGIPLKAYLIYELHTGTFTREGTFGSAISVLPYLKDLGITAIEIMPVASFPGTRNWGYDGVDLYAPQTSYGGPDGLKHLVNACHATGLAVILDVVYNHLGPEGNYLAEFGPFFTSSYQTPWGQAINYDGPESDGVRRFFIENALYWLTEYHIDALRLDAVHGIFDFGARHFLAELNEAFHRQAEVLGRAAFLIAESDLDDVRIINPPSIGGHGIDAQWNDDFHHALHTILTGSRRGYLADYGTLDQLSKAVCEGFVFDGQFSKYRQRHFGSSSKERPGQQFVVFTQNHDQVANTCQGKRLSELVSVEQQKLAAVVLVLSPFLPLLFMGQEYGEVAPFLYFTNFGDPKLCDAVRDGRRKEFAAFGSEGDFADPENSQTFERSKLRWDCLESQPHAEILRFYRDLIALRKIHPSLGNCRKDLTDCVVDDAEKWLVMTRSDPSGEESSIICNFAAHRQAVRGRSRDSEWEPVLSSGLPVTGSGKIEGVVLANDLDPIELEAYGCAVYVKRKG